MNSISRTVLVLTLALSVQVGWAAPCANFNDVDSMNPFCSIVEWLKNREVTLGCGAGAYCPGEAVTRLSMAAFLNRLGTVLTPQILVAEATPGALDVDPAPVICTTPEFEVTGYPRVALLDAVVSVSGSATLSLGAAIVKRSTDKGTPWSELAAEQRGAVVAGNWGSVRAFATDDLPGYDRVQYGVRLNRVGASSDDLSDSHCYVRAVVHGRDGVLCPATPWDYC